MKILLPGIYPRSEKLVACTRDFERGRITLNELKKTRRDDVEKFYKLQNGFKYISTGLFEWQDLLRPFINIVHNSREGELLRFFETNTFCRIIESKNKPELMEGKIGDWIETYFFAEGYFKNDINLIIPFPFLYLFQDFSRGIPLKEISKIFIRLIGGINKLKNKALFFLEPSFGWRKIKDEEKLEGRKFIERLKEKFNIPIFLYTFFFSIEEDMDFIFNLPFDGIGIDFYSNTTSKIMGKFPKDKSLLAGVINVYSTIIEDREKIRKVIRKLENYISIEKIYLIPSGPPEFLPRITMDQKVENLKGVFK